MGVHGVAVIMLVFLFTKTTAEPPVPVALSGCQDTCGNVSIPFPFGIGAVCAANESFVILCKNYSSNPAKPFIGNTSVEVVYISLREYTVSVNNPINYSSIYGNLSFPVTYSQSVLSWTYNNPYCNDSAVNRFDGSFIARIRRLAVEIKPSVIVVMVTKVTHFFKMDVERFSLSSDEFQCQFSISNFESLIEYAKELLRF
ncbi:hypothetical protein RJ640_024651 [Escallonia rubra]|uniref:Wall-associated receptor kinase galacturonan-binding domain-containing protein n=1 Tax=Escallonia rubra TaxID=112253 RepID=A0AA88RDB0_9ASTE|nr:hypothetical protein RJ640_024651 [Escallonia rubra]